MQIIRISAIWCTSCILTYPIWQKIKEKYNYEFIEYDYDTDEELLKKYDIGKILPVIIIMKDNNEITRIIGEKKEKEVIEIIDNIKE